MSVAYWETKRKELVRDRRDELLSGSLSGSENYNPYDPDNMAEFMQEIGKDWIVRLCDVSRDTKYGTSWERDRKEQELGMLFMSYAEQYWTERAEDVAEADVLSVEELNHESEG